MSQSNTKVKITQKDFDEIYEIQETIIDNNIEKEIINIEEKPEPEFLTEEEQEIEKALYDTLETKEEDI